MLSLYYYRQKYLSKGLRVLVPREGLFLLPRNKNAPSVAENKGWALSTPKTPYLLIPSFEQMKV